MSEVIDKELEKLEKRALSVCLDYLDFPKEESRLIEIMGGMGISEDKAKTYLKKWCKDYISYAKVERPDGKEIKTYFLG